MSIQSYAPIVLFVYNRVWHTKQTIDALKQNELAKESELFIYSDAPSNEEAVIDVDNVRAFIKTVTGFKKVTIVERTTNLGLAASIIKGVTEIVNQHEEIIVLEDDLVTSPIFLSYMNEALEIYKNEYRVASIHGYVYPIDNLSETFFIRGADCWGWATWKRAWKDLEQDGKKLLDEVKSRNLQREADFNRSYGYTKMLKDQIKGKVDSWAVRWYMSNFLLNKLTLYPGNSLVQNIGNDNSGTHRENSNRYITKLNNELKLQKIEIGEDKIARQNFEKFFRSLKKNIAHRLIKKIKSILCYS